MFTPEFVSEERGEFVLVANHNLERAEAIDLSISYNEARIAFGRSQLPENIQQCRLIYDIRGQLVTEPDLTRIRNALTRHCNLEFKR
jgi:hypothetical protein